MRDTDPFRFRDDPAWVKLFAWLLLQTRLTVTAICLAICVGAVADVTPMIIKKALQVLISA